jgi:hypothetical protein
MRTAPWTGSVPILPRNTAYTVPVNVHKKEIVTITSQSVCSDELAGANLADLTSLNIFLSENKPGQWICWDFREMRICPTHYAVTVQFLKSCLVESSMDGTNWTEIDRRSHIEEYRRVH